MYSELTKCIICENDLTEVLSLGEQYVVDFVKEKDESLLKAPLTLMRCNKCSFIQLKHRVDPNRLYKKFWYRSGINEQMKNELYKIVENAQTVVELNVGDKVLDIGCNDGTLLGCYTKGIVTFGVDPCASLVTEGMQAGKIDIGIPDFFSYEAIQSVGKAVGIKTPKFKIITAISCFYDVIDPVQFLKDCKALLEEDGVLIIQMNYLLTMLRDTAFDNVCHEHDGYYSIQTLNEAVKAAGLDMQGVEDSSCNGGSIRAYITHPYSRQFSIRHSQNKLWLYTKMQRMILQEQQSGLDTHFPYEAFSSNVEMKMHNVSAALYSLIDKKIYVYGASTRGTVLSQTLSQTTLQDINILGVAERDPNKYGLRMVGTWWPIVSEDEFRKNADVALILPWHFRESITRREEDWLSKGGKMIFPLPDPVVVEKNKASELSLTSTKL